MSPREHSVAYLLDELDPAARTAFEARLAEDAALRAEVDALQPLVARLERIDPGAWDPPAPPAPPRPAAAPAARSRRDPRGWASRRVTLPAWGVAAACAAAVLVALTLALLTGGEEETAPGPAPGRLIALSPVDGAPGASGRVRLSRDEAVVRVSDLPSTAAGDFYELWLLTSPTELVSLGSFRVSGSGDAELRVPVPVDPDAFRYLDVSLEPGDGDPRHSQRSVLRAPLPA